MHIYKTKPFQRWAKSEKVTEKTLVDATKEIEEGLVDAKLSKYLYKKRVGKNNRGKRGSYRTIVAFKSQEKTIFLYGFPKNEKDNISDKEKKLYNKLADVYMKLDDKQLQKVLSDGILIEVNKDEIYK